MDSNNFETIKNSFGNVIYSQKTHEMAIIRKERYLRCTKCINIIIIGCVFFCLFLQIFNPEIKYLLYSSIVFTIFEFLFLVFQLSFNHEKEILKHKITANELWLVKEEYLNLLTDIKNDIFDKETISEKRNELTSSLNKIYENAIKTNNDDYEKASTVLNGNQKPKADKGKMNNFLPVHLQNNDID